MRGLRAAGLVLSAFLMLTLPASAAVHYRGRVVVGPAIGPWGWYSPFYGPYGFYGPYSWYGPYTVVHPNAGELKLKTNVKDADVFINGAYAGKAGKMKSTWLPSDAYNVEIRAAGYAPHAERIYLLPGKTVQVNAEFTAAPKPQLP
jgi:PEGA domain